MAAVIETFELTRSFAGSVALDGLTIDVQRGEVLALLGPNGAGKTTTVRLLDGVLSPDSGSARVLGLDPHVDGEEVRRRTGVLTENAGLDERLTARENLHFTARTRGMPRAVAKARVLDELLERFAMADRADDQVQGFSTGQRKRLALARALLHDPELLFLDEPTSGLDPASTRDVIELIGSLAAEGRTVVLCTHFLGEAGRLAHRMAVLHRGRLHAFGKPDELAAELWDGLAADLDLGAPADERTLATIAAVDGVLAAEGATAGAAIRVRDRAVLAGVVAALVGHEIPVYASTPHPPTLEDVYFAVEARAIAADATETLA